MEKLKRFLFKNTTDKQTVAKNTIWLFLGEIVGRLFKLAIVVFATRTLGIEGWGLFSYGLAFVSFFYLLGDFGINTFVAREIAKGEIAQHKHLGTSFILKIGLLFVLFVLSLVIGPHVGKIALGFNMLAILSLLFFSDSVREFALSVNRSLGRMEQEAFSKIVMNAIITVLGIVLILYYPTPLSLAIAYAVGSSIATVFILWSIRKELTIMHWHLSKESLKLLYDFSWPIIIISLFSFVFNIDSIMLGQLRGPADVGLYAAAQRIVQFIAIIPGFIAMAVFPLLSKHEANNEKLSNIFEKIMATVFALGIPLALGGFVLSTSVMSLVFGHEYVAGGTTLGILMLSLLASFPNIILTNVIVSKNLQRTFIAATSIGVAVNIILNFLLIPRYGAVGAAWSVAITQMLIMIINWQKLKRIISFSVIPKLGIIILSSVLMGITVVVLQALGLHLIITVIIAILLYATALLLFKEQSVYEILSLLKQ